MTGPVVCGVDFSDDARRALRWAAFMARHLHQPLIVVHAVEPLLANAAQVTYGPHALEDSVQPDLDAFIAGAGEAGVTVRATVTTGEPASVINGAALAAGASMLVVGTQGLGQAGRLWFGSTTIRLLRETTVPVLAIPPGAATRSDGTLTVSAIVVGTDFGEASAAAIEAGTRMGELLQAPVTALHAVPAIVASARWTDALDEAVHAAVEDARGRMAASVPAHLTSDVQSGDPAQVLVAAASGRDALIVVGLGGVAASQRPGTTAYRVLGGADGPVLAVPAR
jgi:nucleotide-binding universal stress UspA family protein